ncbi:MAG TPA: hypothetical protein VEM76_02725 [Anaeromyxobacteraceae bacterium]|nr:hypothetical protein [Anaeromyxobacteraceae bacterium]
MRRALLLLCTFGLALSGCRSRCDNGGTLTLFWQKPQGGFTTATGQLLSCDEAGVSTVDVTVNGSFAGHFPCHGPSSDGITLTGFFGENVSVLVDAFDASNNLLYEDGPRSTSTASCGNVALDVTLGAVQAPFQISYALPGGIACPANSFVWLSLVDVTGNVQFDLVDQNNTPTAIPCGTVLTYDKALFGQYRLDFIQVVQPTGIPSTPFVSLYQFCQPLNFNHQAANDDFIVPTLISSSVSCR